MSNCVIKGEHFCFPCKDSQTGQCLPPEGLVLCRWVGKAKQAIPSDTLPNLLLTGHGSLWDADCDSTGQRNQLNIELEKKLAEAGKNSKVQIRLFY